MKPTDRPVERIVCLTEEPTEILYLLGEGERVVGISAYTVRPPEAKRDKPVVSAFVDGSVEKIRALEPDLVIGFSDVQADLAAKLIKANLQVLVLNQHSLREVLDVVRLLGRIVERTDEAEDLVRTYEARIEEARRTTAAVPVERRPRVYFEEWPDPLICGGGWISELVGIAGGVDVFADRATSRAAKGRFVDEHEVLERRPDVILASWCGKPFEEPVVRERKGWDALPALRHDAVHEIDSAIILQPGPGALTDGLAALESILRSAGGDAGREER